MAPEYCIVPMVGTRSRIECESMDVIFYEVEYLLVDDAKEIDNQAKYLNLVKPVGESIRNFS